MAPGAADLPDALVRLPPCLFEDRQHLADHLLLAAREAVSQHERVLGVGDFTVDVKLELACGGVAYRTGPEAVDAGEPARPVVLRAGAAAGPVRTASPGSAAMRREPPVPPRQRLLRVTGVMQDGEGQRGVPQPAIAVIPVAGAADPLGQRGRRGGDLPPACA